MNFFDYSILHRENMARGFGEDIKIIELIIKKNTNDLIFRGTGIVRIFFNFHEVQSFISKQEIFACILQSQDLFANPYYL